MYLLRFTVRNHKSIRDELSLDLTRSSLRTLTPKDGAWVDFVYPIAGIFGPNASGKSAVLDAMHYAFAAIGESSTSWQARRSNPRVPFRLDDESRKAPSGYELEFIHNERRYAYGFEMDGDGVVSEWLRDVPGLRWRTLLDRRRGQTTRLHPSVRAIGDMTDRELALSRAYVLGHPQLAAIADDLFSSFEIVSVKDTHREKRLQDIAKSLIDGSITSLDIETLLQVADIGINNVSVEEKNLPEKFARAVQQFQRALEDDDEKATRPRDTDRGLDSPSTAVSGEDLDEDETNLIIRNLLFTHRGRSEECPPFSIQQESDGTVAWLALMVPALEVLRSGGVLCVDEIDSSLHPHLLDVVLGMFADPSLNANRAQLIFTSHETYILSPLSDVTLAPEQVWFTDKSFDGATQIACLAEFPRHPDANVAKRYLLGRYGGTPRLAPSVLASLLDQDEN